MGKAKNVFFFARFFFVFILSIIQEQDSFIRNYWPRRYTDQGGVSIRIARLSPKIRYRHCSSEKVSYRHTAPGQCVHFFNFFYFVLSSAKG